MGDNKIITEMEESPPRRSRDEAEQPPCIRRLARLSGRQFKGTNGAVSEPIEWTYC